MKRSALGFLLIAASIMAATTLMAAKQKSARSAIKPATEPISAPATAAVSSAVPVSDADIAAAPKSEEPASETPVTSANSAANFSIDWYSINGGGTVNATSTNYQMGASIGQSVAGAATSTNYQMGIGFWYGASGSGGCTCDCHGDPGGGCDGVQDILDVVQTVNVAFRGAAAILDPNAACPYETTDTNCSLSTDVIDVVKMVNVAFRGANAATEFCDPCP